jgi:uncharacterized protein YrrD
VQRAAQIVGKLIVTADTGEKVGEAADLLVDESGQRIVGVVVRSGLLGRETVLPYEEVQAVGGDAIVARSQERVMTPQEWHEHGPHASRSSSLKNRRVVTTEGRQLGTIRDMCVDERTGAIEGYELAERVFAGLIMQYRILPRSGQVTLGPDAVVVSQAAADALDATAADDHRGPEVSRDERR